MVNTLLLLTSSQLYLLLRFFGEAPPVSRKGIPWEVDLKEVISPHEVKFGSIELVLV